METLAQSADPHKYNSVHHSNKNKTKNLLIDVRDDVVSMFANVKNENKDFNFSQSTVCMFVRCLPGYLSGAQVFLQNHDLNATRVRKAPSIGKV